MCSNAASRKKLFLFRPPFVRRDPRRSQYCGIVPNTEFHSRFPETAAIAGGITMFNFNCIQNAIINANAGFQAVLVVGRANAHRVLPAKKTCDTYPVSQCSERMYTPELERTGSSLRTNPSSGGSMHPVKSLPQDSWRLKRRNVNGSISGRTMQGFRSTISG